MSSTRRGRNKRGKCVEWRQEYEHTKIGWRVPSRDAAGTIMTWRVFLHYRKRRESFVPADTQVKLDASTERGRPGIVKISSYVHSDATVYLEDVTPHN